MRGRWVAFALAAILASAIALATLVIVRPGGMPDLRLPILGANSETVEVTDYSPPAPSADYGLDDDEVGEKAPPFRPDLIDRRPEGDWRINSSAAVLRLDVPMLKPDADASFLTLRRSYTEAIAHVPSWITVLPSINLIDAKAKQFDDGLVAAIDLAYYKGLGTRLQSHVALIKRWHALVAQASPASAYLAAGLKIAGVNAKPDQPQAEQSWLERFESAPAFSKPLGFYTWSEDLTRVFRFMRYFQQPLPREPPGLIAELASALGTDPSLIEDSKHVNGFYARLTNPVAHQTLVDALESGVTLDRVADVAVFPSSRSRETELFAKLFPAGLPQSADLIKELVHAIRSGKVDLAPRPDSGWYDYQVYALETFLMPEKGDEHQKLVLTRAYKKRMLEAFAALITKRRETHSRDLDVATKAAEPLPRVKVKPRLRVEPCPSYYLRMARSYDFLMNFLLAAVGGNALSSLRGLKEGGERNKSLLEELRWFRSLFYGIHLLSCEDIGIAPALKSDEAVDRAACEATANEWLGSFSRDTDLRADTRVAVPLCFDLGRRRIRLWATVGVRLAKLVVSYARAPKIKPSEGAGSWEEVAGDQLQPAQYAIAVDEFAEVEIPGIQPLNRKEFRAVCDAHPTKAAIVEGLSRLSR
jgi:hypothetical protein